MSKNFEFKKKVMEVGEEKSEDNLATIQESIEVAVGKVKRRRERKEG